MLKDRLTQIKERKSEEYKEFEPLFIEECKEILEHAARRGDKLYIFRPIQKVALDIDGVTYFYRLLDYVTMEKLKEVFEAEGLKTKQLMFNRLKVWGW